MPYRDGAWVEPRTFLVHDEVTVYHTHANDQADAEPRLFRYTTDPTRRRSDIFEFDVRHLPGWPRDLEPPATEAEKKAQRRIVKQALRAAIDRGLIPVDPLFEARRV